MPWFHNYSVVDHSLGLTAMVAALPIFFLFWVLAYKRTKGYLAASLTLLLMLLVATTAYRMPGRDIRSRTRNGKWPLADWLDHSHCRLLLQPDRGSRAVWRYPGIVVPRVCTFCVLDMPRCAIVKPGSAIRSSATRVLESR